MKRNIILSVVLILVMCVWASTTMISGTMAKYVAEGAGTAQARFASFSFFVNPTPKETPDPAGWQQVALTSANPSSTFTLPLFDTSYHKESSHWGGPFFPGAGTEAEKKTVISSVKVVAPGTGFGAGPGASYANEIRDNPSTNFGYRSIQVKNESEVTVRFRITVSSSDSKLDGVPLMIHADAYPGGGDWFLASAEADISAGWITLKPNNADGIKTYHFGWFWVFDAYDVTPTTAGFYWPEGVNGDYNDSLLGMRAAQFLRSEGGWTLDDVSMKLALKLEVQQVD